MASTASFRWTFSRRFLSLATVAYLAVPALAQTGTDVNNIFSLAPRELRQHLTRAQAALTEERFSDAVAELGEILNSADTDDFLLGAPGSPETQVSLKTQALALLGSMPAKGRKMYELQYGADAKAALEEALSSGDVAELTEVCRRYFHTKAGYEATLLLGRFQLDRGRPLAAALTLKRVADVPFAAAQYDPELSILLATCWVHANQPAQAKATLLALKQRMPQAKIHLRDKEVALFDRDESALHWLEAIVGGSRSALASAATEWTVYRGDEKRNAESSGGVPLLNFNWKLPTVNDPPDEARVSQIYRGIRDRGEPVICALQPLVVQDYAIIRQPESNKLVGINLKKNGKREWVFPPFDENLAVQTARQSAQNSRGPTVNLREKELRQRIWQDHVFGQVSSDGRQVYVIDDLSYAPWPDATMPPVFIGGRGQRIVNTGSTKPHNLLVALDLQKQGYQLWAVGGTTGDNPALAGAFFLGPPLPVGDSLYALAEFAGEIRLVCLDPRNGALAWKQQLAVLHEEFQHITYDAPRRLAAASPSLADGILVCPTSAGAVVAVDLATRTLRWGFQYGRTDLVQQSSRFGSRTTVANTDTSRWLDATATISDGCVILTPVESQQLHCLDLLTGKAKWPAQPREEMLFVACVHQGKIVLVGKNQVKAINLADGKAAWTSPVKLDSESCTGRGYYSEKFYYLPVTGQQLLKIDLDEGQTVARAQTEVELGNVVCYHDQLISQSPQSVASFVLLSRQLRDQLEERLAANPRDIDALSLQAQILLQEGKPAQSLDLLRRAHGLAPEKTTVRGLLVKVMLLLLRQDFDSHLALTEELDKLVSDPAQRREVLRWRVQGLARANRTWDAFEALLVLADEDLAATAAGATSADLVPVDRDLAVRHDRWLQGQLYGLWNGAAAAERARMANELKARLERTISGGGTSQLRMFLNLFGFHGVSQTARLALAEKLIASDALLEAEQLAGELLHAADPALAGAARATLAALYEKAKRPELAARRYQELAAAFGDVVCRDGLTGKALASRAKENPSVNAYLTAAWPLGQVEIAENDASSLADRLLASQRQTYPVQLTHLAGAAPRGLRATYDPQQLLIAVRGDFGQTLATAALRTNDPNNRRYTYPLPYNALTASANGHLMVVNLGLEVAAVDGLRADRGGDPLLWRQDTIDVDPSAPRNSPYPSSRTTNNPLVGGRSVSYDSSGKVNFNTAPVRGIGFCFQRGRQLVCVDPLTGQSLWERVEIRQQAEVFGDDEVLFVAGTGGADTGETLVLSSIDGSLLEKRKIDPAERRWTTCGRNVLAWEQAGSTVKVRLYDAQTPATILWSRQVAQGSRGCLIDGEELALLEPGGQFTVVSLATGAVHFAVPLVPEPALSWIQVIRSSEQYLLLASQDNNEATGGILVRPLQMAANQQQSRMHGRVYAFRRASGKLQWQVPAFVAQHCLPTDQPTESPLLFFVRNRTDANRANATEKASVLALDRRTGRMVYDSDSCGNLANNCDCVADPTKQTVTLTLFSQSSPSSKTLVFQLTDKPTPPQPPAQTGWQASDSAGKVPGVVDSSVGAAVELLRRGLAPRTPPAPANR